MKRRLMTGVLCGVLILSSTMQSVRAEELNEPVISSSMESASDTGSSSSSSASSDAPEKTSEATEDNNASNNSTDNSSNNASTEKSAANIASTGNNNAGNNASSQEEVVTDLTQEIDGKSIHITADLGVLPEGATLVVTDITDDSKVTDAIVDNTELTNQEISDVIAYDISIHDKNGEEIEPDTSKGNVSVVMTDVKGAEEYNVYHVTDDCEKVDQVSAEKENDTVSFDTTHFSYFVLIKVSDITANTETTTIQLDEPLEIGKKYMITDLLTKAEYDYSKFAYVNKPQSYSFYSYDNTVDEKENDAACDINGATEYRKSNKIYYGKISDSYLIINNGIGNSVYFCLYDSNKSTAARHNLSVGLSIKNDGEHQYQLGDKVYADFDGETGVMAIVGTGNMSQNYYGLNGPFAALTIKKVIMDDTVTSVGSYLFEGQKALLDIKMEGVISIDNFAFTGCTSLALTSLPEGITTIGHYTFKGCTSLALTSLPAGVTSIEYDAFYGCTNLALTSLPEGITSIGNYAFYGCTKLALTSLPVGIVSIKTGAFASCAGISSLKCEGFTLTSDYDLPYTFYLADGAEIKKFIAGTKYDMTIYKNKPFYTVKYYNNTGTTVLKTESVTFGSAASYTHATDGEPDVWVTTARGIKRSNLSNISTDIAVYSAPVMAPTVTVSIPESIGLTITDGKITGSVDGILQSDIGTGYINTSPLGSWSLLAPSGITLTNEDGKTISVGVTSSVTTKDAKDADAGKRHTDNRYNLSAAEGNYAPGIYTGTMTFKLQKTVN